VHERESTHARIDYLIGALDNMGLFEALSLELARHRREAAPFAVALAYPWSPSTKTPEAEDVVLSSANRLDRAKSERKNQVARSPRRRSGTLRRHPRARTAEERPARA
jgi:hypothetical protein